MTTSTVHRIVTAAVAVGTALTLTACTGEAAEKTSPTADSAASTSAPPDAAEDTESSTPLADWRGPLDALWDEAFAVLGTQGDIAAHDRAEQLVAECMRAEGWEYTPAPLETGKPLAPETDLEWGTVEFGETHGYAIATGDVESLRRDAMGVLPDENTPDPNFDYLISLPEAAAAQFEEDLWGKMPTDEEIAADPWASDPEGGCQGKARKAVEGSTDDPLDDGKFAGLLTEMNQLHEGLDGDSRIVAARADWSDCMTGAGFADLANSDAAQDLIWAELDLYAVNGQEPPADALAELATKEKALAVADFTCRENHDYFRVELEVRHEREQEFIESHRTEVEEFLGAVAEHRKATFG